MYFYSQGSNPVECVLLWSLVLLPFWGVLISKDVSIAVLLINSEVYTWKVNVADVPNQGLALNTELGCGLTATPEGSVWHHTELGCWPTVSPDGVWHHTWELTDSIVKPNIKYCLRRQKAVAWHHTDVLTSCRHHARDAGFWVLTLTQWPTPECWLWSSDWHQILCWLWSNVWHQIQCWLWSNDWHQIWSSGLLSYQPWCSGC